MFTSLFDSSLSLGSSLFGSWKVGLVEFEPVRLVSITRVGFTLSSSSWNEGLVATEAVW
jgi:hypothetical protein